MLFRIRHGFAVTSVLLLLFVSILWIDSRFASWTASLRWNSCIVVAESAQGGVAFRLTKTLDDDSKDFGYHFTRGVGIILEPDNLHVDYRRFGFAWAWGKPVNLNGRHYVSYVVGFPYWVIASTLSLFLAVSLLRIRSAKILAEVGTRKGSVLADTAANAEEVDAR